jgi:1-deoxy-D-xylulose-5-phosphate synthase
MSLLPRIQTPADVKKLSPEELEKLAGEMRARIIDAVGKKGGHLASNGGVVEMTKELV